MNTTSIAIILTLRSTVCIFNIIGTMNTSYYRAATIQYNIPVVNWYNTAVIRGPLLMFPSSMEKGQKVSPAEILFRETYQIQYSTHKHTSYIWCPCMAIDISVQQYNGGLLPDIILLTLCYYIGKPF